MMAFFEHAGTEDLRHAETRQNLPSGIVVSFRNKILSGRLAPGDRLPPERELAAQLGTNRNTLREALRVLEGEGLLKARQGDGVRVLDYRRSGDLGLLPHYFAIADLNEQLEILAHMMRVRSTLAVDVMSLAVRRGDDASLARLDVLVDNLAEAVARGEVAAVVHAELEVYEALLHAGRSVAATLIFNSMRGMVHEFLRIYPAMWLVPPSLVASWRRIVAAARQRDLETAQSLLTALLRETDTLVMQTVTS